VAEPTGDLDDQRERFKEEVHTGDMTCVASLYGLCLGSRQLRATDESEETTLEHGVTAAVEEQAVKRSCAPTARPAQFPKSLLQDEWCRQAQPQGAVDGPFQAERRGAGAGEIDDRARRRGTSKPVGGDRDQSATSAVSAGKGSRSRRG
jgi:hypothetical protein